MALKVYIVYYSVHGNVERLAKEMVRGVNSEDGVEAKLWQVPETLSTEELAMLGALPRSDHVPIITPNELTKADGFFFGFPTISGMMAAPFKAFLDGIGDQCKPEHFKRKPAGVFICTSSQVDRKEIVGSAITQLENHGMIYVPSELGYTYCTGKVKEEVEGEEKIYGAGTYSESVTDESELEDAYHRGAYLAFTTKRLKDGYYRN